MISRGIAVAEALPLPFEDEAAMQIRHAKADDECEEEHHGGEDAGDPGEREQNLPDANVDGVGAYVDEHEFLQALVEAGAEDEGGRDQRRRAGMMRIIDQRRVPPPLSGNRLVRLAWPSATSHRCIPVLRELSIHSAPRPSGSP